MTGAPTAAGSLVRLRPISAADLERAADFMFTLSIIEPLVDLDRLHAIYESTGFWLDESGALAIEELPPVACWGRRSSTDRAPASMAMNSATSCTTRPIGVKGLALMRCV